MFVIFFLDIGPRDICSMVVEMTIERSFRVIGECRYHCLIKTATVHARSFIILL